VAVAKGEAPPARVYADVDVCEDSRQAEAQPKRIRPVVGLSKRVVQDWEQNRKAPSGAARSLLKVAQKEPAAVRRALVRQNVPLHGVSRRLQTPDHSPSPTASLSRQIQLKSMVTFWRI